jgi:hypothetical protein
MTGREGHRAGQTGIKLPVLRKSISMQWSRKLSTPNSCSSPGWVFCQVLLSPVSDFLGPFPKISVYLVLLHGFYPTIPSISIVIFHLFVTPFPWWWGKELHEYFCHVAIRYFLAEQCLTCTGLLSMLSQQFHLLLKDAESNDFLNGPVSLSHDLLA